MRLKKSAACGAPDSAGPTPPPDDHHSWMYQYQGPRSWLYAIEPPIGEPNGGPSGK